MQGLNEALLYGGMAGILGTGLGGLFGYTLKNPGKWVISSLMNFSGGLMVAIVCFDLLPTGYGLAGVAPTLAGVAAGVLLLAFAQKSSGESIRGDMLQTGILLSIGIALHNFPEGLAIGAGFARAPSLGFGLCIAIALHDVPEGLAIAVPLRAAGICAARAFLYALAAGLPTVAGVLLGYAAGRSGQPAVMISVCMGVASGAMLYVVTDELLPGAFHMHDGHLSALMWVLGLIAGSLTILFL